AASESGPDRKKHQAAARPRHYTRALRRHYATTTRPARADPKEGKEVETEMLISPVTQFLATRGPRFGVAASRRDERLRRAGYADGERRPRKEHHWANR